MQLGFSPGLYHGSALARHVESRVFQSTQAAVRHEDRVLQTPTKLYLWHGRLNTDNAKGGVLLQRRNQIPT